MRTRYFASTAVEKVYRAVSGRDIAERMGRVVRTTFDQLYDGRRSGRYRWEDLFSTERRGCEALFKINLKREFRSDPRFGETGRLDFLIAGVEVVCCFAQGLAGWNLPRCHRRQVFLLVRGDDAKSFWQIGAADPATFRGSSEDHAVGMNWIIPDGELPPNALLQMESESLARILDLRSSDERLIEFFRQNLDARIGREAMSVLSSRGCPTQVRSALRAEGIVLFPHSEGHLAMARKLGATEPGWGEWVPLKLVPTERESHFGVEIGGSWWRVADPEEKANSLSDLLEMGRLWKLGAFPAT